MTAVEGVGVQVFVWLGIVITTYYVLINAGYLIIHILALFELRDNIREAGWEPPFHPFSSPFYPSVAMVVPAYNEQATIVESVRSMLALNYPDQEIVVVNDGSTDATLARLREAYDLEPVESPIPYDVPTEPIRAVYRSIRHEDLLVVDKENGGKSDALNAGIWVTDQKLFCAVDSDTLIDRNALLQIVRPFLEDPERAVASGGTIRVANDCEIADGEVQQVNLPRTRVAGLQAMEYLRAFYSGRLGFNRLKGLILISGAFGIFRTDYVREIGGYRQDTITEDFDVVVRLHQYLSDNDIPYTVDFIPEPVAWTEVPENRRMLGRQRRRWYRGMIETVVTNRKMILNRKYGRVGTVILPFFIAAEALGPLIEGVGYILLPLAWYVGILSIDYFVAFFLLTTGFGLFLSWFGIFSEVWSFNRYENPRDILRLLWYGVLENFGYRQWKTIVAWQGLIEYLRGEKSWGAMERRGFGTDDDPNAAETDTAAPERGVDDGEGIGVPTDPAADAGDDSFIWGPSLAERPDHDVGGLIWTTDPTDGVGDGGFVWVQDPIDNSNDGGFVWTTDFRDGVGNDGVVWTADLPSAVSSGAIVWSPDHTDEIGDDGFIWPAALTNRSNRCVTDIDDETTPLERTEQSDEVSR